MSFRSKSVGIVYRKISPKLYWGCEERATRYNKYLIAEPERALLDWIYLNRQDGLPTPLNEPQPQFLNPAKLREYAQRFPRNVSATDRDLLVENSLPVAKITGRHGPGQGDEYHELQVTSMHLRSFLRSCSSTRNVDGRSLGAVFFQNLNRKQETHKKEGLAP